jgi:nitrogen regulatory protein P-II 1
MKMIEAIIHQFRLQEVTTALDDIGVVDFVVTPILCHGGKNRQVVAFRGAEFVANAVQKVKVEVISPDDSAGKIIKAIESIVKTGHGEDCRIGILQYLEVT